MIMEISEEKIRQTVAEVLQERANKAASGAEKGLSGHKEQDAEGTKKNDHEAYPGFRKVKDPSGIIKIATSTVKCERFEQDGVALKDVVTLEEAPHMGCGIMELDRTSFEWTLSYDEYDMVISGLLEIEIDGRILSAGPGEIIYIPKGSHIHFQTRSRARYAYFTYPADWQS